MSRFMSFELSIGSIEEYMMSEYKIKKCLFPISAYDGPAGTVIVLYLGTKTELGIDCSRRVKKLVEGL